ncbi:hypothetical protein CAPTEDRAFT_192282 [Capitella teleta]|uniref:Uncharacterized protein n=1 Tax=Capitella teleta TaxID=283909 RepID=R7UH21_CAPTE|nr:hypothetical protein CAPTEDRAFT_192282 [Capitella teleta]|eukprot:ELU03093.1 hypothetical protein CAPTEDRAFT_192282 [Capitella teleta]
MADYIVRFHPKDTPGAVLPNSDVDSDTKNNLEWTQQRQRYWSIYSMILMDTYHVSHPETVKSPFLLTDNLEWTQQRQGYWSIYSMILMMPCDREEEITTAFVI